MNNWTGMGRLVRDPEVRYTQSGKVVVQFTLAINRNYKNAEGGYDADFINCVAWGKIAERIGNSVTKGQRLLVEGSIRIRSYETKDGGKRWVTEIQVDGFEYVEKKDAHTEAGFTGMGTEIPVPFNEEVPY